MRKDPYQRTSQELAPPTLPNAGKAEQGPLSRRSPLLLAFPEAPPILVLPLLAPPFTPSSLISFTSSIF